MQRKKNIPEEVTLAKTLHEGNAQVFYTIGCEKDKMLEPANLESSEYDNSK